MGPTFHHDKGKRQASWCSFIQQFMTAREVWLVLHDGGTRFAESLQWPVVIIGHNFLVGAGHICWVQHAHFSQPLHSFLDLPLRSAGPTQTLPFPSVCVTFCSCVEVPPQVHTYYFPWIPFMFCSAPCHISVTTPTSSCMSSFISSTTWSNTLKLYFQI